MKVAFLINCLLLVTICLLLLPRTAARRRKKKSRATFISTSSTQGGLLPFTDPLFSTAIESNLERHGGRLKKPRPSKAQRRVKKGHRGDKNIGRNRNRNKFEKSDSRVSEHRNRYNKWRRHRRKHPLKNGKFNKKQNQDELKAFLDHYNGRFSSKGLTNPSLLLRSVEANLTSISKSGEFSSSPADLLQISDEILLNNTRNVKPFVTTSSSQVNTRKKKIRRMKKIIVGGSNSPCNSTLDCLPGHCCITKKNKLSRCKQIKAEAGRKCWDTCMCANGMGCFVKNEKLNHSKSRKHHHDNVDTKRGDHNSKRQNGKIKRKNGKKQKGLCKIPENDDVSKGIYLKM